MLAILFIGARMRALQITEQEGQPQGYAQQAMYMTTWCINFQIFLVTVFGLLTHIPIDGAGPGGEGQQLLGG